MRLWFDTTKMGFKILDVDGIVLTVHGRNHYNSFKQGTLNPLCICF